VKARITGGEFLVNCGEEAEVMRNIEKIVGDRGDLTNPLALILSKGRSWFDKPVLSLTKGSPRTVSIPSWEDNFALSAPFLKGD
jgi:hypothetical protein